MTERLLTTGFSSQAERQIGIWDMRNFSSNSGGAARTSNGSAYGGVSETVGNLELINLDQGTGALYPTYDPDTRMLYI